MVAVAISKVDSIDALVVLPMTVTFMVILLLADIMVLNQQRTITVQQQDIKDYQTYEPMAHDLISDILGKQHDFNNQMNAIRMLPYTYKDYDSLSDAIANYSTFLEEEFNESELLKINLPVVAGFVFSKIKEAEQKGRLISVKIKNRSLITPVPEYDLIRILGILIDNAIEATEPGHTFSLILDSKNEHIRFQTKNEGGEISSELRKKMFVRGYSTKTSAEVRTSRGQGLPNLKELVDHYNGKIYLDNETFHEHTWICFTVEL
ncbi:MAG: sensor histidine kinase [Coprococcus sp.]